MSKINLNDATKDQLRHHAEVVMGLDVHPNNNGPQILAKISAADPSLTEIDVPDVAQNANEATAPIVNRVASPPPEVAGGGSSYHHDPKVKLMIPSSKEPGGERDVQVAVNGQLIIVQRDQVVEMPYRHYEAMLAAVEDEINQTPARPGEPARVMIRKVPSYNMQVLGLPTAAEIAAYRSRTDHVDNP